MSTTLTVPSNLTDRDTEREVALVLDCDGALRMPLVMAGWDVVSKRPGDTPSESLEFSVASFTEGCLLRPRLA